MTRTTTYHKTPHDNDADNDKYVLSGIVSRLVVCGLRFSGLSFITHIQSKNQESLIYKHVGP
jgi:hypothetical protein